MSLKSFLKGKKTYLGLAVSAIGMAVPYAPQIMAVARVNPDTASKIISVAGLLYAAYGRKVAKPPGFG